MKTTLTVKEASEFTGMSEMMIRIGLRKGIFAFGYAVKKTDDKNSKYII